MSHSTLCDVDIVECDPFLQLNIARRKKEKIGFLSLFIYIYIQMHTREGKMAIDKNSRYKKKDCTLE